MGYRVVVAGATGNVGREMLNILAEREFPIDEIAAVASARSQGDMIEGCRQYSIGALRFASQMAWLTEEQRAKIRYNAQPGT